MLHCLSLYNSKPYEFTFCKNTTIQKSGVFLVNETDHPPLYPESMAWTPDKVAALISSRGDTSARAAQLKEVLDEIRAENNDSLAALVEKLADGARDCEFDPMVCCHQFKTLNNTALSSILEIASGRVWASGARLVPCACEGGTPTRPEQAGTSSGWQCMC